MASKSQFPEVAAVATLIVRGPKILAVYNPRWGSFTLPMTKIRHWDDPQVPAAHRDEPWIEAAGRAAAEWLGATVCGLTEIPAEFEPFQQSDRDGVWKRYTFRAFRVAIGDDQQPLPGAVTEWLTAEEFLNPERRPISPTSRHVIAALLGAAIAAGRAFP